MFMLAPLLAMAQGSLDIYVSAQAAPNVYAWDGAGKEVVGKWPGYTFTEADLVEVGGKPWYKKTFTTSPLNIIFNNGKGGQTGDIKGVSRSSFYEYDGTAMATDVTEQYAAALNPDTVKPHRAWVYVNTTADVAPYLYTWGFGQADLTGKWPGTQMTGPTVKVGDKDWYKMSVTVKGGLSVILNDGGDAKHENVTQTDNIENLTDSVIFLTYDGTSAATVVTDDYAALLDDTAGTEPVNYVFTVFAQGPEDAYVYAYADGKDLTNKWAGDKLSALETATTPDGKTWAVRRFSIRPEGLLFTMGQNGPQTGNITKFGADSVYYIYDGASSVKDVTTTYVSSAKPVEQHMVKVYVNATTVPYLYAYNKIRENIVGGYPGKKMNAQKYVTADNKEWYLEEFQIDTVSVILHQLPANNQEDVDPTAATVENIAHDVFITYDGLGHAVADSLTYKGQDVTMSGDQPVESGDVKIFVQMDGGVPFIHAWDANGTVRTNAEWPGELMDTASELTAKDGHDWYQRAFDIKSVSLVINNGKVTEKENFNQTGDITDITSDQYFIYDGGTRATNVTGVINQLYSQRLDTALVDTTYLKYQKDGQYAYFAAPADWTEVYAYAYNTTASEGYVDVTPAWPGKKLESVGETEDGLKVYKWATTVANKATNIIFSNGSEGESRRQTADGLPFYNGGYYTMLSIDFIVPKPALSPINPNNPVTAIDSVEAGDSEPQVWYTISGQRVVKPVRRGLYICNGRKVLVR